MLVYPKVAAPVSQPCWSLCMITTHHQTQENKTISWYASSMLPVPHGMFCRTGGISKAPYASLNLGFSTGDDWKNVAHNRKQITQLFSVKHLVSAIQVHGREVACVEDVTRDYEVDATDALITNQPGVGLLIQQADCQAILFYDPVRQVIGAAHSGWRGSVLNIVGHTIKMMTATYGTRAADVRAVISPSLGPCCAEFVHARSELPGKFFVHQAKPGYFDFWAISCSQLQQEGVRRHNIDIAGECTVCTTNFFSYRRTTKKGQHLTGRNGSIICLPQA